MRVFLITLLLLYAYACSPEPERVPDPVGGDTGTETDPTPLRFVAYTYADSVPLRPHGPFFTYRLHTLRAEGGDTRLTRIINDTLAARLWGFVPAAGLPLDTAVEAYLAPQFADYLDQEVQEEWLQEAPQTLSREQDEKTEVLYRTDSLLVLAHHYYEYTGGAHGMHFTELLPFRTEPPRLLTYGDLFPPDAKSRLEQLLTERAAREPDRTFGDSIPVTRNVAPLADGVRFLYEPYAIGPYASGEIAIDLPYADLRELLRAGAVPGRPD